jgi:hypothetical protein
MASADDINSTLQNIVRQFSNWVASLNNAFPPLTASTSPVSFGTTVGTTISQVIGTSTIRHGIIFHNPGTIDLYVFPSLNTAVATNSIGGSILIFPGGTWELPSAMYPNVNCAWSAFATTGSTNPFTVVEFY